MSALPPEPAGGGAEASSWRRNRAKARVETIVVFVYLWLV